MSDSFIYYFGLFWRGERAIKAESGAKQFFDRSPVSRMSPDKVDVATLTRLTILIMQLKIMKLIRLWAGEFAPLHTPICF